VQQAIVRNAAARVRDGGRLLYVTCSTHHAEDEDVVDAFLSANAAWSAMDIGLTDHRAVRKIGRYALTIPGIDGGDGFFYALLRKADDSTPGRVP
jgi:16S rRNA (cytosine967-C5)-methyltransferase